MIGGVATGLVELRLAEGHAHAAKIQKQNIYKATPISRSKLEMEKEAKRYARLAR
jgi:hypothetical protein